MKETQLTDHHTDFPEPGKPPTVLQPVLPGLLCDDFGDPHFIMLKPGSKIPAGPWRDRFPTYDELRAHVDRGGNAGIVPYSIGAGSDRLTVLDVDEGDPWAVATAYPPLAATRTRRGTHLWYSDTLGRSNGLWRGPGGATGDVRGSSGYVALHSDALVRLNDVLPRVDPVDCRLPSHLIVRDRPAEKPRSIDPDLGLAMRLIEWGLGEGEAKPADTPATVGTRHVVMVQRMARWAGRRTWNKADVDTWFLGKRAASYWLGLPDRSSFPLEELAGILSWVLAMRATWAKSTTSEFRETQARRARRLGVQRRKRNALRDRAIIEAVMGGQSMRSVAREHGLPLSTVQHIMARDGPLWRG